MEKDDIILYFQRFDPETTTKLSFSNRDLDFIPEEIGRFKKLKHLDLSYNNLKTLPEELFTLPELETLLLFRNDIEELQPSIGHLSCLRLLDISYNPLTSLPAEIGGLNNLKIFDAGHCKIEQLPLEMIHLLSLKDLYLEENPLQFPPFKVVARGLYATMYYLAQEKKKRDAAKVIVQIYNMPDEIQAPFKQYINCFNDVVSNVNSTEVKFGVKFINQYHKSEVAIEVGVQNYLYDFLNFIQTNINNIKIGDTDNVKLNMFNLQVVELRNEISNLNESLNEKMNEISEIQKKIYQFNNLLKEKE